MWKEGNATSLLLADGGKLQAVLHAVNRIMTSKVLLVLWIKGLHN